ncbi:MAG: DNA polymerase III subunit alpha [Candidatus Saccharimonadales bacterium]
MPKEMTKQLTAADFVHLHNHTQYSLLDGLTKVPALISSVKEMGMEAVAITDHGTLSGAIEFYKQAKTNGIKPVIGIETYVASRSHTDKDVSQDKNSFHLIILAMNNTGYRNLMKLSTIANLDGYYYKPRIDHQLLEKYNEGLIVLSGCIGGEVGDALRQNQYAKAKKAASWYQRVFGDRYYLEIQDHGHPEHDKFWQEQVAVTEQTFKLAGELGIDCVLTCDAHYLKQEDQDAHEILLCVQTGSFLTDENRLSLKSFDLHVTEPEEIIKRWGKDHPEVITNSRVIAERCDVQLDLGKILIPKFEVPSGETESSYLRRLVYQGLGLRYGNVAEAKISELTEETAKKLLPKDIVMRAEYELEVIDQMNFNGYFLIISDFINWGKDRGIVFGPGRGSAAGSIISYALKITELDPLKYDLLFERFLNPDRISMPDIDIDIQDTRRDEVIKYCVDKYGEDRVANIVTFGRMAARNAVRDVARVLQVPYADSDRLAKMIPPPIQGRHIPLIVSLSEDKDLKNEYDSSEQSKQVFDLAMQLEGTIRSHGVHAAGVVVAPEEIVKYTPLEMAQKGVVATQYSMGPIEEIGLLKIDFLGLSNLTIIKNALRIVKRVFNADIELDDIPLDDPETFDMFKNGETTGVFQLESAGMKRYLKQLKPTEFEDIIAMVALYRPGPMQWIDDFIARKHGEKQITYLHEAMRPALENTYGVIVYQEQVMQISKDMCGFSGGQADTLRKAIGKKDPEVLAKLKNDFIEGAIRQVGADRDLMESFWKQLEDFAAYCFNKSHAACYGMIAYWTAYLKAHYPAAYMAALMTSDFDNTDRLSIEINECKNMGIDVQAPDVNESFIEFAVVPGKQQIRFGLAAIKNVGTGAVEEILRARQEIGGFKTLEDFFGSVNVRTANRKTMEALIKAGALDRFDDRRRLLNNLDTLLGFASRIQKGKDSGQTDLFGDLIQGNSASASKLALIDTGPNYGLAEQLQWERELLGVYLSQHPLDDVSYVLAVKAVPISSLAKFDEGKTVTIGGHITEMREITTKNGQKMAFVKLADLDAETELVLFPGVYQQSPELWKRDNVVLVKGKVSRRGQNGQNDEPKILASEARLITDVDKEKAAKAVKNKKPVLIPAGDNTGMPSRVYIRLADSNDQTKLMKIKAALDEHSGQSEVLLVLGPESTKQVLKLPLKIDPAASTINKLAAIVGADNVKSN